MPDIIVRVKTKEQFRCIPETKAIRTLIVDASCLDLIKQKKKEEKDRKYYLQFPDILKESKAELQEALLQEAENYDGLVVRNFDQLGLLRSFQKEDGKIPEIIGDSFLYSYNPEALAFYRDFFPAIRWVLSDELTDKEAQNLIKKADTDNFIYKVYGYQTLMVTNQCIRRNYQGCRKGEPEPLRFTDEKNNAFYAVNDCTNCYNLIYNGQPTMMLDKLQYKEDRFFVDGTEYPSLLIDFTIEKENEIAQILGLVEKILKSEPVVLEGNYTRGHHYKGVE